jgi:transcriptional regulator with XRE-family HTH domain
MIIPSIARGPNNGHEYCDKPNLIIEEAERRGLSRAQIAEKADVDISTVRNWVRKNEAALKPIQRLAKFLNDTEKTEVVPPLSTGTDLRTPFETIGGGTEERVEGDDWEKRGGFISLGFFDKRGQQETTSIRLDESHYESIQRVVTNKGVSTLLKQAVEYMIRQDNGV